MRWPYKTHNCKEYTNVAVEALGRGRGEAERCFLLLPRLLRTSLGVAIALTAGSGGVRYQDVVVGPQDFRSSASHFRLGKLGLFSMFSDNCGYSPGAV
jgi:hypothetical protein